MLVKGGDFETHLKIKGRLQYPISVDGKIIMESPHFLLRRPDQFKNLHLPENHSALGARLECKNFEILGGGIQLPFKDISAEVILEQGTFRVSGLRSNFGHSIIRNASLEIEEIFRDHPTYETLIEGSFDLNDLVRQREMGLIPSEVRNRLSRVEDISGNLRCNARFRYEPEWKSPRITSGALVFKDCLIEQRELFFPLWLKEAEIHIDKEDQNRFDGIGNWGNTTFKVTGAFGITGNRLDLRGADLSAHVDMNQVIPFFYDVDRLPMEFKGPVQCRISTKKEKDLWSCQGRADLDGVVLESDHLSMDSLGKQDRIVFDLDFKPQDRIDLKKILFQLKGSSLELSGSYNLKDRDDFTLKVNSPGLSLEDLGIRGDGIF